MTLIASGVPWLMDRDLTEALGYAAAGLVLACFSVRSIKALRGLAIASNVLFIAYAACAHLLPVLVLHALLLPINLFRLRQELAASSLPRPTHGTTAAPADVTPGRGTNLLERAGYTQAPPIG